MADWSRRAFLTAAGAFVADAIARPARACVALEPPVTPPARMPVLFVGHGSPLFAVDMARGARLRTWAGTAPAPRGVVALTPHFRSRGIALGAIGPGQAGVTYPDVFAPRLGHLRYDTPTNASLAARVVALLRGTYTVAESGRTFHDHTVWGPLRHAYPAGDVPVLELGLPFMSERELFELGRHLAPLREVGVLLVASGNVTHNLASIDLRALAEPEDPSRERVAVAPWAHKFDAWVASRVSNGDVDALVDWRQRAPYADLAHPDDGAHFSVMMVLLGAVAATARGPAPWHLVTFLNEDFVEGTLSMRALAIG